MVVTTRRSGRQQETHSNEREQSAVAVVAPVAKKRKAPVAKKRRESPTELAAPAVKKRKDLPPPKPAAPVAHIDPPPIKCVPPVIKPTTKTPPDREGAATKTPPDRGGAAGEKVKVHPPSLPPTFMTSKRLEAGAPFQSPAKYKLTTKMQRVVGRAALDFPSEDGFSPQAVQGEDVKVVSMAEDSGASLASGNGKRLALDFSFEEGFSPQTFTEEDSDKKNARSSQSGKRQSSDQSLLGIDSPKSFDAQSPKLFKDTGTKRRVSFAVDNEMPKQNLGKVYREMAAKKASVDNGNKENCRPRQIVATKKVSSIRSDKFEDNQIKVEPLFTVQFPGGFSMSVTGDNLNECVLESANGLTVPKTGVVLPTSILSILSVASSAIQTLPPLNEAAVAVSKPRRANAGKPKQTNAVDQGQRNVQLFALPFRRRSIVIQTKDLVRLQADPGNAAAMNEAIMDYHVYLMSQRFPTSHIFFMRALLYVHLRDRRLGNKSQAKLNLARGLNIFLSRYLFLPLYSNLLWHWASCLIVNLGSVVNNDTNKDPTVFPCILELNSLEESMVEHNTILAWLNEEFQLQYASEDAPFTADSMPYFRVPLKRQPTLWECGFIVALVQQQAAKKLTDYVVTVSDRDDKFASFAKFFKHTPNMVKKARGNLVKKVVEASGLTPTSIDLSSPAASKDGNAYIGYAAATPDRKQKAKNFQKIGIKACKGSDRLMDTSPNSCAQCKDGKTREKIARTLNKMPPLWHMTEMGSPEEKPRMRVGLIIYDEILGNAVRKTRDDETARRAKPKLTVLFSDKEAAAMALKAMDQRNSEAIDFVQTTSIRDVMDEIHDGKRAGMKVKRTHKELVAAKGNERIKADMAKPAGGHDSDDSTKYAASDEED